MKLDWKTLIVATALALCLVAGVVLAQNAPVVGSIGVTVEEVKVLATGWSIKKDILGKDVFNETNEKVGTIEDIIVTPERGMSYAIVGAGGFLGMDKHDVPIPINQFNIKDKRIVWFGATKEAIKAMPTFHYAD
ncbi:MAG: PRC-barrel domain-containing protein [Alphaproteobacteria bacterium]|nr:PRC-barrel domain-containing protein [Desulfovibrionaceae bacterium]MBF0514422.1 PRC-barrel domain-containing protein [Desulfovibrionaceae bacterium]MBF0562559.1 PRC-barrel domain-containing protein [Alphaproteobacteria bacterium]